MAEAILNKMPWKGSAENPESLLTREWLVTNGLGGYASGSIAGVPVTGSWEMGPDTDSYRVRRRYQTAARYSDTTRWQKALPASLSAANRFSTC